MVEELPQIRIFVSSPGDVGEERLIVARVLIRLQGEFLTRLRLDPIFWEHEPVRATADYQSQFPLASACDIVVCILWSRLGTRLPDQFKKPDGSPYDSGTEFEFEDAKRAHSEQGVPDLLVFRKTAKALADLADESKLQQLLKQKRALDAFLDRWFGGPDTGFTAGFTTFADAAEFEERVETHLKRLLEQRLPEGPLALEVAPTAWHKGSPFRGLEPFEAEHAPSFFGRTRAVSAVRELLVQQHSRGTAFLLLLGASGSGKSSLLRAGVAPTLTTPGVIEGTGLWRTAIVRPGDSLTNPLESLAAALTSPTALPELLGQGYDRNSLLRAMSEAPQLLDQPVQAALRLAAQHVTESERLTRPPVPKLLLIVDQFEQLFTIPGFTDENRAQFVKCLSALARSGSVWVAAGVRSDFYHRCLELPDLSALKADWAQSDLLPPSLDELQQMIVQPARAAGLRFEQTADGERLDALLQEAAAKQPGALPLLEFALEELYRRAQSRGSNVLTIADYRAMGGIEGALAKRAEEVFDGLPSETQAAFAEVMSLGVSVSSAQGLAAMPILLRRLASDSAAWCLIDALVNARLMVTDSLPDGTPMTRLAHDSLLTHWPRLKDWVHQNEDQLRTRARITTAAQIWEETGGGRSRCLTRASL